MSDHTISFLGGMASAFLVVLPWLMINRRVSGVVGEFGSEIVLYCDGKAAIIVHRDGTYEFLTPEQFRSRFTDPYVQMLKTKQVKVK